MSVQIPTYPLKTDLTFDHQEVIKKFHQLYTPRVSSTSFSNLFILDTNNDTQLSLYADNLLITQQFSVGETLITIVGNHNLSETINTIKETEPAVIELWEQTNLGDEDLSNAEYLYNINDILNKEGQGYASFRRKLNSVDKILPLCKVSLLEDLDPLWDLAYPDKKRKLDEKLELEQEAFEKMLLFEKKLLINIFGIFNGSELIAFTITEKLNEQTLVIHFFKSKHEFTGLAEKLFFLTAEYFQSECTQINFQQDLGIPGLRQFKESLRPSALLIPRIITS